ncbi:hypothetical protein KE940_003981 [Escherichia coli]|nr:hypothetical protein [Escherichia coli]HBM9196800.1 hypothetical protein [Escherichia coli]
MATFSKFAVIIILLIPLTVTAGEQQHCTKENEHPFIVIQCDDGTVTVVNVRNDCVAVCRKGEPCKEIKL